MKTWKAEAAIIAVGFVGSGNKMGYKRFYR